MDGSRRPWQLIVVVYEINTWTWLREWSQVCRRDLSLADLPDGAWDELQGYDAVWLMGVWERSPAGVSLTVANRPVLDELRRVVPDLRPRDVIGSPYCIRRYAVDSRLGGARGLAIARKALERRGIRLLLDFVPNHVAPDHPWVSEHPEWMMGGTRSDLAQAPEAFLKIGRRVFARGRDPFFPPWSDVLQLNVFAQGQRQAALAQLQIIANHCDGVRCDMAMLVLNEIFARTWGQRAGPVPAGEYWPDLIGTVKTAHPGFHFMAEAYWDREAESLGQGFDTCYDKGLYDCLVHGTAETIQEHLVKQEGLGPRLVRFLENHDEPRAARVFPGPKGVAAATVWLTLPGVHLLHHGQLEGRRNKAPLHLDRELPEAKDPAIRQSYTALLRTIERPVFQGEWALAEVWSIGQDSRVGELLAWAWRKGEEGILVIVNYGPDSGRGCVQWPWRGWKGKNWRLMDLGNALASDETVARAEGDGWMVALEPWACAVLELRG